jgi:hypothetical protein
MRDFTQLRGCLQALADNADILPASGGAAQYLIQPDQDEKDDEALTGGGGVCDKFGEEPMPRGVADYVRCEPSPRTELNRYRYFLDGAMRSYYLCSVSEHNVTEPVLLGEIGAAVIERLDDGSLRPHTVRNRTLLLINTDPFSDALRSSLKAATKGANVEVINTGEETPLTRRSTDDPSARAQGCARWQMRQLERECIDSIPEGDHWIILDGPITSQGSRTALTGGRNAIGVAKSFSKSPKFRTGRSAQQMTVTRLVAALPEGCRTPLFVSSQGDTAFWYVRLWAQGAVDYPMMGVVKCDIELPSQLPVIQRDLANELTSSLLAERRVTPYGKDSRWHSLLYPIHIAEQVIRTRFMTPLILRESLSSEWCRILKGT